MPRLAFIDGGGQVMATQSTPKEPAPTKWETELGYTRVVVPDNIPLSRDVILTVADGIATAYAVNVNPVQAPYDYYAERVKNYPELAEQFDMIFTDLEAGNFQLTGWRDAIRAIKEAYLKP